MSSYRGYYAAKSASYEEFLATYDRDVDPFWTSNTGGDYLSQSLRNSDPVAKVNISSLLLDDGADPSKVYSGDNINALHILFGGGVVEHDFDLEAPLLKRLLDGGADVNLRSPRFGCPLESLSSMAATDDELQPFYDVVFARPDIDMSAIINERGSTLGDLLTSTTRPGMTRRAEEYMERTEGRNE